MLQWRNTKRNVFNKDLVQTLMEMVQFLLRSYLQCRKKASEYICRDRYLGNETEIAAYVLMEGSEWAWFPVNSTDIFKQSGQFTVIKSFIIICQYSDQSVSATRYSFARFSSLKIKLLVTSWTKPRHRYMCSSLAKTVADSISLKALYVSVGTT